MKNALILIDFQNDFMDIKGAALPVTGATKDADKIVSFVSRNTKEISTIVSTLDSHHMVDIAHPSWWITKNGTHPAPFTAVTTKDLMDGEISPKISPTYSRQYIADLERQGEFIHIIWPPHCIIATWGHNIYEPLMAELNNWHLYHKTPIKFVTKGSNQFTEHFGALRANIPMADDSSTQLNLNLIQQLETFDRVFLAGEARDYCVVNTLNQLMTDAPNLLPKLIILEDAMSNVGGNKEHEQKVNDLYTKAQSMGAKFEKAETYKI